MEATATMFYLLLATGGLVAGEVTATRDEKSEEVRTPGFQRHEATEEGNPTYSTPTETSTSRKDSLEDKLKNIQESLGGVLEFLKSGLSSRISDIVESKLQNLTSIKKMTENTLHSTKAHPSIMPSTSDSTSSVAEVPSSSESVSVDQVRDEYVDYSSSGSSEVVNLSQEMSQIKTRLDKILFYLESALREHVRNVMREELMNGSFNQMEANGSAGSKVDTMPELLSRQMDQEAFEPFFPVLQPFLPQDEYSEDGPMGDIMIDYQDYTAESTDYNEPLINYIKVQKNF